MTAGTFEQVEAFERLVSAAPLAEKDMSPDNWTQLVLAREVAQHLNRMDAAATWGVNEYSSWGNKPLVSSLGDVVTIDRFRKNGQDRLSIGFSYYDWPWSPPHPSSEGRIDPSYEHDSLNKWMSSWSQDQQRPSEQTVAESRGALAAAKAIAGALAQARLYRSWLVERKRSQEAHENGIARVFGYLCDIPGVRDYWSSRRATDPTVEAKLEMSPTGEVRVQGKVNSPTSVELEIKYLNEQQAAKILALLPELLAGVGIPERELPGVRG